MRLNVSRRARRTVGSFSPAVLVAPADFAALRIRVAAGVSLFSPPRVIQTSSAVGQITESAVNCVASRFTDESAKSTCLNADEMSALACKMSDSGMARFIHKMRRT